LNAEVFSYTDINNNDIVCQEVWERQIPFQIADFSDLILPFHPIIKYDANGIKIVIVLSLNQ